MTATMRISAVPPPDETLHLAARSPWMDHAACSGHTQLFFGQPFERPERRQRREARAAIVCADCPVIEPCRRQARLGGESGYWGGESEEDRATAGFPPIAITRRSVQAAAVDSRVVLRRRAG